MVCRPDGSYAASSEEMHKLILDAGLPICRMFEHVLPASWGDFEREFGMFFPSCNRAEDADLTGKMLHQAFQRMRATSATGADGWRVAELRVLPVALLDLLADVLLLVERAGRWPEALSSGLISLIDKRGRC